MRGAAGPLLWLGGPLLGAARDRDRGLRGLTESGAPRGAAPSRDADALVEQAAGRNPAAGRVASTPRSSTRSRALPEFAEPFSTSISGAFRVRKGSALPDYELDMGVATTASSCRRSAAGPT